MECSKEQNAANCACTYTSCSHRGACCKGIQYHLKSRELPGCCFPHEAEKTYDRSFATRKVGDSLRVEYDPADPSRARPVGGCASLLSLRLLVMILLLVGTEFVVGVAVLRLELPG